MGEDLDIRIEIHFRAQPVSGAIVIDILKALHAAIIEAERDEINDVQQHFSDTPRQVIEAAYRRLDSFRLGQGFNIEQAHSGSLILIGAAAALGFSYWLADKTLGESVSEAWKESELHGSIKNFLKGRVFKKRDHIAKNIRPVRGSSKKFLGVAVVEAPKDKAEIHVEVIPAGDGKAVPKPSDVSQDSQHLP